MKKKFILTAVLLSALTVGLHSTHKSMAMYGFDTMNNNNNIMNNMGMMNNSVNNMNYNNNLTGRNNMSMMNNMINMNNMNYNNNLTGMNNVSMMNNMNNINRINNMSNNMMNMSANNMNYNNNLTGMNNMANYSNNLMNLNNNMSMINNGMNNMNSNNNLTGMNNMSMMNNSMNNMNYNNNFMGMNNVNNVSSRTVFDFQKSNQNLKGQLVNGLNFGINNEVCFTIINTYNTFCVFEIAFSRTLKIVFSKIFKICCFENGGLDELLSGKIEDFNRDSLEKLKCVQAIYESCFKAENNNNNNNIEPVNNFDSSNSKFYAENCLEQIDTLTQNIIQTHNIYSVLFNNFVDLLKDETFLKYVAQKNDYSKIERDFKSLGYLLTNVGVGLADDLKRLGGFIQSNNFQNLKNGLSDLLNNSFTGLNIHDLVSQIKSLYGKYASPATLLRDLQLEKID